MASLTYQTRRGELTTYFDRTAADAWEALTSDAKVSRIRETVRAGRDRMRALLLSRLPHDLTGRALLDAGCGTGALAIEAARRGAAVTAVDVSPRMIDIARDRTKTSAFGIQVSAGVPTSRSIAFAAGDMLDRAHGHVDHVVAMDSLIHYRRSDIVAALAIFAKRTRHSIVFTVAPRTPLLAAMHGVGRLFPRGDRAPGIEPVAPAKLAEAIAAAPGLTDWRIAHSERIASGFYMSQAIELVRG